MIPATQEAYQLFHDGMITLAEIEENGVGVDVVRLEQTITDIQSKVRDIQKDLKGDNVYTLWRRRFGDRASLTSDDQLAKILFSPEDRGGLGYKPVAFTEGGRPKVDEEELIDIDHPFVQSYLKMKKWNKILGTYLDGIRREVVPDRRSPGHYRIHPNYNLNTVRTYRSSSDNPNFQNIPNRDPETADTIRGLYIPRPGNQIVEIDFSQLEVRIGVPYHNDPVMITYICDTTKDMHRDMAMQIYCLGRDEFDAGAGKRIRHAAKNSFVFPAFYGDYYISCASHLWHRIRREGLATKDGTSLYKHLKRCGIKSLGDCDPRQKPRPGTFEHHLKKVEDHFWKERFAVYGQWRLDWYAAYQETGSFQSLSGFYHEGIFKRNDVINYPIQGSAFHCTLWSLNRISAELRRRRMKTQLIGEIHDSIIGESPAEEVAEFIRLCRKVMTQSLRRHYSWINVPIEVEAEVSPVGRPWSEKKKWAA